MSKPKNENAPWTPKAVAKLAKLAKEGKSSRQASKELGRSVGATKYKAMTEGIRFHFIDQPIGAQARAQRTIRAKARKRSIAAKKGALTRARRATPLAHGLAVA